MIIGAVIDPRCCLNLLEASALDQLRPIFDALSQLERPPENKGGPDRLQRHLDCAVIEMLHAIREQRDPQMNSILPAYQTVRGVFQEGEPIYPDAGFHEKNHIQIVVRDLSCIKGFFRPLPDL